MDFVFHTASPFFGGSSDPQKDLIDPALLGTTNVMNSCAKTLVDDGGVKKVVVTSSMAAVRSMNSIPKNGEWFTEEDWNYDSQV